MATAILVGLPRDMAKRVKAALGKGSVTWAAGWNVEFHFAKRTRPEIFPTDIKATIQLASESAAHIVGISNQPGPDKQAIAREIRPYFRFRWLDIKLISHIGFNTPEFITGINAALDEESLWAERVKPRDTESPLLLPGCSFATDDYGLWDHAMAYGDVGNIDGAAKAIDGFRRAHWEILERIGARWVDKRGRLFDHTGARHGKAPFPRSWKYSYSIPEGFHYDVTASSGKPFAMNDHADRAHPVVASGHLNIDPHGYVRG